MKAIDPVNGESNIAATIINPMIKIKRYLALSCVGFAAVTCPSDLMADDFDSNPRPNVLMIIIDDLNDWTSHLGGHPQLRTPNIDRIVAKGVAFSEAHTMAPQCNPSRRAFFSGLPPFVSGIYTNSDKNKPGMSEKSLFRYFRQSGYYVAGGGKIIGGEDLEDSTDVFKPKGPRPKVELMLETGKTANHEWGMLPDSEEGTEAVEDERTVQLMEQLLAEDLVRKHNKPFFLISGFYKPHLPWFVPKRFYDMHPLEQVQLPEILVNDRYDLDQDAFCHLTRCNDNNTFDASDKEMRELVRAYMACASYTDENVGRILDAFEKGPNRDRETIIILWSDHGYHLGEKQQVAKRTLWNESTRAPFIWVVPGLTPAGEICNEPVDFSRVYTTLCELAGLQTPQWVTNRDSLVSLLKNPDNTSRDGFAVSTYKEGNHSIVSRGYRLIRYSTNAPSSWELYNEKDDPSEWINLLYGKLETLEDLEHSKDPFVRKAVELNLKLEKYLEAMK